MFHDYLEPWSWVVVTLLNYGCLAVLYVPSVLRIIIFIGWELLLYTCNLNVMLDGFMLCSHVQVFSLQEY